MSPWSILNKPINFNEEVMRMCKQKKKSLFFYVSLILLFALTTFTAVMAQPVTMGWGNLNGIRYQGELIKFKSSLCVIGSTLRDVTNTAKEEQRPHYELDGHVETITTQIEPVSFKEVIKDLGNGSVEVTIKAIAEIDSSISGAFLCLELPYTDFDNAEYIYTDSTSANMDEIQLFPGRQWRRWRRFIQITQVASKGLKIKSATRELNIETDDLVTMIVYKGNPNWGSPNPLVYLGVKPGVAVKGESAEVTFKFSATGKVDNQLIHLTLDPQKPGRVFDGLGGNFRLQYPEMDQKVIDYCLENLNVTWGRVHFNWRMWHADETEDPLKAARAGKIHPRVEDDLEMAKRLYKRGMPVIVSVWSPPEWAIEGKLNYGPVNGVYGNPLKQSKMRSIIKSLTSYLVYLKEAYGVEAAMFSFNESDLGINVRFTGEEHAALIKNMGSYMASQGLATKMLLGDNSDANTYEFVTPAINDVECHPYIGAVSFHSWRGFDNWTLGIWRDIAQEMNVPLIVGEGGVDASAHRHPDIFLQPTFALNEIDIYVRIGAICQARSILQWQLTADYSLMQGKGLYEFDGKFRPTQRFYNLKQYGITPSGSFNIPISGDGNSISRVAYGDIANGVYSIHIVNNGAERKVILKGLPDDIKKLKIYTTDRSDRMKVGKSVPVSRGSAEFILKAACFTSLISTND